MPVECAGNHGLVDCSISTHVQRDQPRIASAERWDRTRSERRDRLKGIMHRLSNGGWANVDDFAGRDIGERQVRNSMGECR